MSVRICLAWISLMFQVTIVYCQGGPPSLGMTNRISVLESAANNSVIFTLKARAANLGNVVTISTDTLATMELVKVGPSFNSGPNEWSANITLVAALDRDSSPSTRQLYFILTDVNNGAYIQVRIILIINDVNDNPPSFVNLPYRVAIGEDYAVGLSVFKVSATDPDNGNGGQVTYSIVAANSGYNNTFDLDSNGIITLSKPLDYERMSFYHYNVTATDKGNPPCPGVNCLCNDKPSVCDPGPVDLFITIIDVQDTPPVFEKQFYMEKVAENETKGYIILQVKAVDGDMAVGQPNLIQYSITEGDSSPFVINETDGTISVKDILDADLEEVRNKGGLFIFTVTATEISQPGSVNPNNSTNIKVAITVTDVNDNQPQFSANNYSASVQENTPSGVPITITSNIEVYDNDQGMNSQFQVYLEKDGAPYDDFETLPKQGSLINGRSTITIRVSKPSILDYEKIQNITFKIIAKENNSMSNTSSEATVILFIEDTNDNSPNFTNKITTFNVSEDEPIGHVVATVTATDADSGNYGKVLFRLEDDGFNDEFNISEKGVIQLAQTLDRETRQSYTLTVAALDNPGADENQRRTSTLRILINVADVNDNSPIWTQYIQYVNVRESSKIGLKVTDLRADDKDEGLNGQIEYSISPGTNGSDLFNITKIKDSAEISVLNSLIDNVGLRLVRVLAEDKGTPSRNATLDLFIFVIDENQNYPVFVHPDQNTYNSSIGLLPEIMIDEEQHLGSVLYTLSATDKDTDENGHVMYYLEPSTSGDYTYFSVNRINGEITSADRLDRERKEIYEIQVRAQDNGQPAPLSTPMTIRIQLNDINDNEPTYKTVSMPQHMLVQEEVNNVYIGQILPAIDLDAYPNNQTCYYLYGGDHMSGLSLNKQTRSLSLTQKVDRETKDTLNIIIKASENCNLASDFFSSTRNASNLTSIGNMPPLYNSSDETLLWVKVTVNDTNDNPPQFVYHDFAASTIYDVDIDTQIINLADSVTDKDTPVNSKNHFKLQSLTPHLESGDTIDTTKDAFVVLVNGSIRTNIRFQSDILGYFLLKVMVYDDDGMNDTANIRVYLISTLDRLMLVFNKLPVEVGNIKDSFIRQLSDILNLDLVMDKILSHTNADGTRDPARTDAYIYGRYRNTGKVVPAAELRQLLDYNSAARALLYGHGVSDTQTLTSPEKDDGTKNLTIVFAITASILGVIGVALFIVLIHMVTLYRRRLRAATTTAYSSSPKEKEPLEHPGTNMYFSAENPLFGKTIKQVSQDEDEDRTSHNSLDMNAVDEPGLSPTTPSTGPDEEQEIYMQITEDHELSNKYNKQRSNLDQVLQAYNNDTFEKDDDDDGYDQVVYDNSGKSKHWSTNLNNEGESHDDTYSPRPDLHVQQSHLDYTEI